MPSITTRRRLNVLHAVKDLLVENEGIPPTIREVAEKASMTRSSTYRHISALCDIGLLATNTTGSCRGVRVLKISGTEPNT